MIQEKRYIELAKDYSEIDFVAYSNFHVEIIGYWDICVEGCSVFRVHSIQVVVQGYVKNIPTICMCGTVFELDMKYRHNPNFKYIILNGDYSSYENYYIKIRGDPGECAGPCIAMSVDTIIFQPITVSENSISQHLDFILLQNYPNPFNSKTDILFSIAKDGFTTLKI